jgi:uncharacterized protein
LAIGVPMALLALRGDARATDETADSHGARGAIERFVASSPSLERADDRLSATFRGALQPLSSEGRARLEEGQAEWQRSVAQVCGLKGPGAPSPGNGRTADSCLEQAYRDRQRQLSGAAVSSGGLVIHRVDSFSATQTAGSGAWTRTSVSYPAIDRPGTDGERAWNRMMADRAHERLRTARSAGGGDIVIDYQIHSASPEYVSVSLFSGTRGPVAGDRAGTWESLLWLLGPERPLKADELFDPERDWPAALAALVAAPPLPSSTTAPQEQSARLIEQVTDPGRWTVSADGLGLHLPRSQSGMASGRTEFVIVPWAPLEPFLRKDSAIAAPLPPRYGD